MTTQPTNSIDSELEEILNKYGNYGSSNGHTAQYLYELKKLALQAIAAKYVSRKEIEEAINNVTIEVEYDDPMETPKILDRYRNQLRAKLLPPTKGGKE